VVVLEIELIKDANEGGWAPGQIQKQNDLRYVGQAIINAAGAVKQTLPKVSFSLDVDCHSMGFMARSSFHGNTVGVSGAYVTLYHSQARKYWAQYTSCPVEDDATTIILPSPPLFVSRQDRLEFELTVNVNGDLTGLADNTVIGNVTIELPVGNTPEERDAAFSWIASGAVKGR